MLRETRSLHAPELDASHHAIDLRSPWLRVGVHRARNLASDFGLVEHALPFVHRLTRPAITILLEGRGRFDEGGKRVELAAGDLALSDQRRGGTEAYAGQQNATLIIEWDPDALGVPVADAFAVEHLTLRDRERLASAAAGIEGAEPEQAALDVLEILRGIGLPFERLELGALTPQDRASEDQALITAIGEHLSHLHRHPSIDDVVETLGWGPRLVHRRLEASARRYGVPWEHWRAILHYARIVTAIRLLGAPGATTETVARLTGFRAPTALCHAFGKLDLPSPGALARAARGDVLDAWGQHVSSLVGMRAA